MNSVSVVVPCFNSGLLIEDCIISIKNQEQSGFNVLEILVIDDGSTYSVTLAALQKLTNDPSVTVLKNSGIKGSAGARNTGIKSSTCEWIAFLDADDWWPSNSLSLRYSALESSPEAVWIGGDFCDVYDDEDKLTSLGRFSQRLSRYKFLEPAYSPMPHPLLLAEPLQQFLTAAPTCTCVTMVRRETLLALGGFAEHLLRAQDVHLWVRLAATHPFLYVPNVLAYYRHHATNSTKSASHTLAWRAVALGDLAQLSSLKHVRRQLEAQLSLTYLALSYEYRKEGRFGEALRAASAGLKTRPYSYSNLKSVIASFLRRG